eukprot:TRINITY_DN6102_c0_g1_i1.p1 TRINITY_DN6102_c0_g1~~TRINITY_DN6102_c0_g1_i1.p1  ORF type:complete len:200 (-),score=23.18 TRINITY_DN6102_c0_g1_i1:423-1022(-)
MADPCEASTGHEPDESTFRDTGKGSYRWAPGQIAQTYAMHLPQAIPVHGASSDEPGPPALQCPALETPAGLPSPMPWAEFRSESPGSELSDSDASSIASLSDSGCSTVASRAASLPRFFPAAHRLQNSHPPHEFHIERPGQRALIIARSLHDAAELQMEEPDSDELSEDSSDSSQWETASGVAMRQLLQELFARRARVD